MGDFVKGQFDKLLLTSLIVMFGIFAFHAYHYNEGDFAQFAVDNSKLFSGALLTLITGRLLGGQRNGDNNAPNPQPRPTDAPNQSLTQPVPMSQPATGEIKPV